MSDHVLWHQSGVNKNGDPFVQLLLDEKVVGGVLIWILIGILIVLVHWFEIREDKVVAEVQDSFVQFLIYSYDVPIFDSHPHGPTQLPLGIGENVVHVKIIPNCLGFAAPKEKIGFLGKMSGECLAGKVSALALKAVFDVIANQTCRSLPVICYFERIANDSNCGNLTPYNISINPCPFAINHGFGLFLNGSESPQGSPYGANSEKNQEHRWQICGTKKATEIAVRFAGGCYCLIFGCLLIYGDIPGQSLRLRLRRIAGPTLIGLGLAAFFFPPYYEGDCENNSSPPPFLKPLHNFNSEQDAFMLSFMQEKVGLDVARAMGVIVDFRKWREARGKKGPVSDSREFIRTDEHENGPQQGKP